MDDATAARLVKLNAEFYQTFAVQFSATRQRIQPGVQRILETAHPHADILDLGCGNGELARLLAERGHRGQYVGVDFSAGLLEEARAGLAGYDNFRFVQSNLAAPTFNLQPSPFNLVFAFATLHHLPARATHLQILRSIHALLAPDGHFIHSNWQFLNSERLRMRIQPWDVIGLSEADVDPGDYLLDWRRGGTGYRYVHHFSEAELRNLAAETGFQVVETFYSDGDTGNLGLYQIWKMK